MRRETDTISPAKAGTLPGLFLERVRRTPAACAYRRFDRQDRCCERLSWAEVSALAGRWQAALRREGFVPGDRVAIMLRNSLEWVLFDLAALGLGLVTVPVYVDDQPDNCAFILAETGARCLLIEGVSQWERLRAVQQRLPGLVRIVSVDRACAEGCDPRLVELAQWLPAGEAEYADGAWDPAALATIVYTSGTTGSPKGVMLSHRNILTNAWAGLQLVPVRAEDLFLSFLPLSHSFERTAGYYAPMMAGAGVAHIRSHETIPDDFLAVRPTLIISVPRIFERVHKRLTGRLAAAPRWRRRLFYLTVEIGWRRFLHSQQRGAWSPLFFLWPLLSRLVANRVLAPFGGRMRLAISGGAPLSPEVSRLFIALGLTILQGYGLTEAGPVVAVNTPDDNFPATVGRPLPGVAVRAAANGELLVAGESVMAGYWQNQAATAAAIDAGGWLHTGDQASIDGDGHITITGRLKEIIVLANGEKVAPEDLEMAISIDPLFEQVLIVGEGRPYLAALVVLNGEERAKLAARPGPGGLPSTGLAADRLEQVLLERIAGRLARFPGYARVRRVGVTPIPWSATEGLLTVTLKLRRRQLLARFADEIAALYSGH